MIDRYVSNFNLGITVLVITLKVTIIFLMFIIKKLCYRFSKNNQKIAVYYNLCLVFCCQLKTANSELSNMKQVSLRFFPRGNLRLLLTSPMGTTSTLLFERPRDVLSSNFDDWPFLSVHFWGEKADGRWTLQIINAGNRHVNSPGKSFFLRYFPVNFINYTTCVNCFGKIKYLFLIVKQNFSFRVQSFLFSLYISMSNQYWP